MDWPMQHHYAELVNFVEVSTLAAASNCRSSSCLELVGIDWMQGPRESKFKYNLACQRSSLAVQGGRNWR